LESYGSKEDSRRQYDVLVLWKHPMARLWGMEFGVFDQTPPKMGSSARSSFLLKTTIAKALTLVISLFGRLCKKTQPKCRLGLAGLGFRASQMPRPPLFPVRYPPHGLGRAALDSDHAECVECVCVCCRYDFNSFFSIFNSSCFFH